MLTRCKKFTANAKIHDFLNSGWPLTCRTCGKHGKVREFKSGEGGEFKSGEGKVREKGKVRESVFLHNGQFTYRGTASIDQFDLDTKCAKKELFTR